LTRIERISAVEFRTLAATLTFTAGLALALPLSALAEDYSDQQLRSFAVAAIDVNRLSGEWRSRIDQASSEDEALRLRQEANAEILAVIEAAEGVSPEEYLQIAQEAQEDEALRARIAEIIVEVRQQ
jgi:hypothetical protein